LPQDVIRCDATTVSGAHEVTEGGLLQFGHSKDDPTRPQIKVMMGSLDPLGMPLATDVLSGERADDGLYIPIIERIRSGLNKTGLLFVGDCKMSALATRAHVVGRKHFYLSPLPLTGATAEAMADWIRGRPVEGGRRIVPGIVRLRLAEIWHVAVIVYVVGIYLVWAFNIAGGFFYLLRATIITALVIGAVEPV